MPNTVATGAPVISDLTPLEGQALTLNTASIADPNGVGPLSYQWQSSADGTTWTNIGGATKIRAPRRIFRRHWQAPMQGSNSGQS